VPPAPFRNLEPFHAGLPQVLRMLVTRRPARWPRWVEHAPQPKPETRIEGTRLRVTFVNHATVLVQTAGLNLLTDPHYSKRCSPLPFAGPKRVHAPGVAFGDLPPIDVVLLSHNHYDHLDIPILERLCNAHTCTIVAGLAAARDLPRALRGRIVELGWWEKADLGLMVHFVPAQHFSARGFHDRFKVLWGGFVVETPAGTLYFAGDTAYGRHFKLIRERLGAMRHAILPVGAYEPRWFMKAVHMIPEEAVRAFVDLGCRQALAVHWGCFQLTDEPILEPIQRLGAAVKGAGIVPDRFRALDPGMSWDFES
jgi:L-ascorbate metabolism protein UlaG (beta-lactamase superfamily)